MVHAEGFDPYKRSFLAYRAAHAPRGRWSPVPGNRFASQPYYATHDTRQLKANDSTRGLQHPHQHVDDHTTAHRFSPGITIKEPKRATTAFMSVQPRFSNTNGMRELHPEERKLSVLRKTLSLANIDEPALSSPNSVGRGHNWPPWPLQTGFNSSSVSFGSTTSFGSQGSGSRCPAPMNQPYAIRSRPSSSKPSPADSLPGFLDPKLQANTFFRPRP